MDVSERNQIDDVIKGTKSTQSSLKLLIVIFLVYWDDVRKLFLQNVCTLKHNLFSQNLAQSPFLAFSNKNA